MPSLKENSTQQHNDSPKCGKCSSYVCLFIDGNSKLKNVQKTMKGERNLKESQKNDLIRFIKITPPLHLQTQPSALLDLIAEGCIY